LQINTNKKEQSVLRGFIKCVEDHKLKVEFLLEDLRIVLEEYWRRQRHRRKRQGQVVPAVVTRFVGMDNQRTSVQDSVDMSISSDEDDFAQQKEGNVELAHDHDEAEQEVLLQDPVLAMTFDSENDVREYYQNYAKSKGFGVTKRSSHTDNTGEVK
jgi:hypothetical protein